MKPLYRIADEPAASKFSDWSVRPFWALLGSMLGGAWLGFLWFVFNGFAVGSPHRKRELVWAIAGIAGSALIALLILWLDRVLQWDAQKAKLAVLALTLWKVTIFYILYTLQSRSFDIYEYYGGKVRNGMLMVFAAYFLRSRILGDDLPVFWWLVLS